MRRPSNQQIARRWLERRTLANASGSEGNGDQTTEGWFVRDGGVLFLHARCTFCTGTLLTVNFIEVIGLVLVLFARELRPARTTAAAHRGRCDTIAPHSGSQSAIGLIANGVAKPHGPSLQRVALCNRFWASGGASKPYRWTIEFRCLDS